VIQTVVLLVDFPDRPHSVENTALHYEAMLFGLDKQFVTGSMREYYRKISNFKAGVDATGIDVQGYNDATADVTGDITAEGIASLNEGRVGAEEGEEDTSRLALPNAQEA